MNRAGSAVTRKAFPPCPPGFVAKSLRPPLMGSNAVTETSAVLVPRTATLDGFAATSAAADGISLRDLGPLTTAAMVRAMSAVRECDRR